MATADEIEKVLREKLDVIDLKLTDISGNCGVSFTLEIISNDFVGCSPVARNQRVHEILKDFIPRLHALEIKCMIPK